MHCLLGATLNGRTPCTCVLQMASELHYGAGYTALMLAVERGHTELVSLLLAKGADPGLAGKVGHGAGADEGHTSANCMHTSLPFRPFCGPK